MPEFPIACPQEVPPLVSLTPPERLTLALDLRWSIEKGSIKADEVEELMKALEHDPEPEISAAATGPKVK